MAVRGKKCFQEKRRLCGFHSCFASFARQVFWPDKGTREKADFKEKYNVKKSLCGKTMFHMKIFLFLHVCLSIPITAKRTFEEER